MNIELIFVILIALVGFFMLLYFVPLNLWITAIFSGVQIDIMELVFMRIRKSPVKEIVHTLIACKKAGVTIEKNGLETHALAGGDVNNLGKALIKAQKEEIQTDLQELTAVDLAGNDLMAFLEKKKHASTDEDLKKKLCQRIVQDLTDDQLKDLDRFMSNL